MILVYSRGLLEKRKSLYKPYKNSLNIIINYLSGNLESFGVDNSCRAIIETRILNLQNIANGKIDLNDEKLSNKDYIYNIFLQEVNIRNANKTKDIRKQARLPEKIFDKTRITEGLKWQLDKLSLFDFASARQNIFIVGDCSTGKTSLAVAIGNEAIEKGARVIYIKFDDLLTEQKLKKKI